MEEETVKYKLRFLVMPDYVYEDEKLNDISRRVYCFIHTYKGDSFFFSNIHMAGMFKCSEWAIQDAVQRLIKLDYIEANYQIKGGGGKIRFIKDLRETRTGENPRSEHGKTHSPIVVKPSDNVNKNKDNNIKVNKESVRAEALVPVKKEIVAYKDMEQLGEPEYEEIAKRYDVPVGFVRSKAEDMWLWAGQQPMSKKLQNRNWKLTLMNWVKRDGMKIRKEASEHVSKRGIDARSVR